MFEFRYLIVGLFFVFLFSGCDLIFENPKIDLTYSTIRVSYKNQPVPNAQIIASSTKFALTDSYFYGFFTPRSITDLNGETKIVIDKTGLHGLSIRADVEGVTLSFVYEVNFKSVEDFIQIDLKDEVKSEIVLSAHEDAPIELVDFPIEVAIHSNSSSGSFDTRIKDTLTSPVSVVSHPLTKGDYTGMIMKGEDAYPFCKFNIQNSKSVTYDLMKSWHVYGVWTSVLADSMKSSDIFIDSISFRGNIGLIYLKGETKKAFSHNGDTDKMTSKSFELNVLESSHFLEEYRELVSINVSDTTMEVVYLNGILEERIEQFVKKN